MKRFINSILSRIGKRHPELIVQVRYLLRFHKLIDLDNPKNLNEKIQYLSLRTDTSSWSRLSDKYQVREYVRECGMEEILVPLLGKWDSADDIDFDALPSSFIMKTTHGSGDSIIVKDKSCCNIDEIKTLVRKKLHETYGLSEGNPHYSKIKPAVVAEKLLENDVESAKYSSTLIDYKIWCFNGKAYYVWTCTDRTKHGTRVMTYDTDWNAHPEYSVFTSHYMRGDIIPKPEGLDGMLKIAETLAKPFPVVRVDLYNLNGKVYFGEMTFTSLGGLMDFYTSDFLSYTGSLIDL